MGAAAHTSYVLCATQWALLLTHRTFSAQPNGRCCSHVVRSLRNPMGAAAHTSTQPAVCVGHSGGRIVCAPFPRYQLSRYFPHIHQASQRRHVRYLRRGVPRRFCIRNNGGDSVRLHRRSAALVFSIYGPNRTFSRVPAEHKGNVLTRAKGRQRFVQFVNTNDAENSRHHR